MTWKNQQKLAEVANPFGEPKKGPYQNPYDKPANAIDKQFYSPDEPATVERENQPKGDPIGEIMSEFKAAQARQAQPRGRGSSK